MWTPTPVHKHALPVLGCPTYAEAMDARWFSPLRDGRLALEARTWVPAMVPWRASADGFVTGRVLAWYERLAQGRPGALVVEATGIRDVASGPLLRIGDDRFIPGLFDLARTVRQASHGKTRLFIQLIDFLTIRRRPTRDRYLLQHLRLTDRHRQVVPDRSASDHAVREALLALPDESLRKVLSAREFEDLERGSRERVTDTESEAVESLPRVLPELFARAAVRAQAAGFDGVELHYAHAYTMASFLSALNVRTDGYGLSLEGRVRLPLEVFHAVRRAVRDDFVVGCRVLTEECIAGGSTAEDALFFARRFAEAGFDFLSLSRGGKFEDAKQPKVGAAAYPYTGRSGFECMPTVRADAQGPFGRNRDAARRLREHVRGAGFTTPIVLAGGIASFDQAEQALRDGTADVVASARQTLADPDWFLKLQRGQGALVRRCTFTNYCEGLDQAHEPVTCKLWDRKDLNEPGVDLYDGRRLTAPPFHGEDRDG